MRKKILFVITKSNWGGAQKYIYELASSLPREQFEAVVATGGDGMLCSRLREAGVRVVTLRSIGRDVNPLKEWAAFVELVRVYRALRPDIIHLNSSKAGTLGAAAAFVYKIISHHRSCRTIFTVHGWGFNEDRSTLSRAAIFAVSWIASQFHDGVVVINNADYASARRFIPKHKLAFIPLGIAAPLFLPRDQARAFFAEKIGATFASGDLLFATIAELTPNKGIIYLLEAMRIVQQKRSVPTMHMMVIGDGEQKDMLRRRVKMLGTDRVHFIGFVPDAAHYLAACDAFILPSLKEGLPYAIMEAMASHLPVVATRVGGVPDLVEHDRTGLLVPPKNPARMAEACEMLLTDESLRRRLGTSGASHIAQHHARDPMIRHTIALYANG